LEAGQRNLEKGIQEEGCDEVRGVERCSPFGGVWATKLVNHQRGCCFRKARLLFLYLSGFYA